MSKGPEHAKFGLGDNRTECCPKYTTGLESGIYKDMDVPDLEDSNTSFKR